MSDVYDPLSPLDIELKGKDFTPALIPEGSHPLQLVAAELRPNKAGTNMNLYLKSTVVNPTPTTVEGVVAEPGERNFETWDGVYTTEAMAAKGMDALDGICSIIDAVLGTSADDRPNLNEETINQMVGRQFVGLVKHQNDPQFGTQDRLVRYLPSAE